VRLEQVTMVECAGLDRLEREVAEIRLLLERMNAKIDQLPKAADFFELRGRVSQLPTVWQLFSLVVAIFALAFALVRFGLPLG
jgi:hypothetical protein